MAGNFAVLKRLRGLAALLAARAAGFADRRGPAIAAALRAAAAPLHRAMLASGLALIWLPGTMALIVGVLVAGRFFLEWTSVGLQESVLYLHALGISGAVGYTLASDEHVRIDLLRGRMTPRGRALVDLLGTLLLLAPFAVVVWIYCWGYVAAAWSIMESSPEEAGLPLVWLLKTMLLLLPLSLLLAGLALALRSAADLLDPPPPDAAAATTAPAGQP